MIDIKDIAKIKHKCVLLSCPDWLYLATRPEGVKWVFSIPSCDKFGCYHLSTYCNVKLYVITPLSAGQDGFVRVSNKEEPFCENLDDWSPQIPFEFCDDIDRALKMKAF